MRLQPEPTTMIGHKHTKALTTVYALPFEVLSTIFVFFCEELFSDRDSTVWTRGLVKTPMVLGAVCHIWRSVAWTSPRLWADIHLPIGRTAKNHAGLRASMEEWLQRSGTFPLRIHLNSRFRSQHPVSIQPLIALANGCADRWKSLEIVSYHPSILTELLNNNSITNSSLELLYVTLNYGSRYKDQDGREHFIFDMGAHSPRHVTCFGISPASFNCRWHLLEKLSFAYGSGLTVDRFLRILREAPRLAHCSVCVDFSDVREGLAMALAHNRLEVLELSLIQDFEEGGPSMTACLEELLSYLTLPSLESLEISYESSTCFDGQLQQVFNSFLSRSLCFLKKFKLDGLLFLEEDHEAQLVQTLLTMPLLEQLEIATNSEDTAEGLTNYFFMRLSVWDGDRNLVPHLKHFNYMGPCGFSLEKVAEISCGKSTPLEATGTNNAESVKTPRVMDQITLDLTSKESDAEGSPPHGQPIRRTILLVA